MDKEKAAGPEGKVRVSKVRASFMGWAGLGCY